MASFCQAGSTPTTLSRRWNLNWNNSLHSLCHSHLQFLQFICAPWSGQPNPLRRMLCQPKPLRTAYLRQPNEDQDKHALVRLAQISNLRPSKHGSRLYDKHDLIEYIEMPSKSESGTLFHLSYRDNQGRFWGILVFSCFDFLKVKTWQNNFVFWIYFFDFFYGSNHREKSNFFFENIVKKYKIFGFKKPMCSNQFEYKPEIYTKCVPM